MRERFKATKLRNVTPPSIDYYITYIILIIGMDGLEKVSVSECVIAV